MLWATAKLCVGCPLTEPSPGATSQLCRPCEQGGGKDTGKSFNNQQTNKNVHTILNNIVCLILAFLCGVYRVSPVCWLQSIL